MNIENNNDGIITENNSLWNKDLHPIPIKSRTWKTLDFISLWISLSVCIASYMLGAGLVAAGLSWWLSLLAVALGSYIIVIPIVLIGHAGAKYGIPFPVFLRSSFGTQGARFVSIIRAAIACGWFGICTYLGGNAIYMLLLFFFPTVKNSFYFGDFVGLNIVQLWSFLVFWLVHVYIVHKGMEGIRHLEDWAAPLLILSGLVLAVWAWGTVGSLTKILHASYGLKKVSQQDSLFLIFISSVTAVIGCWSTLAVNIPDFTRFSKSQKNQILGQLLALPLSMTFYCFIGIFVTSATPLIYGKVIWQPIEIIGQFSNPFIVIIGLLMVILVTLPVNTAANLVAPANDFSNLFPRTISFKRGGYLTCIIGLLIFPWKILANPNGYIHLWLVGYSPFMGALAGIMICDYFLLRKTRLDLKEMFKSNGKYTYTAGWNIIAFFVFIVSVLPSIPGFLLNSHLINEKNMFPKWLLNSYNYDWFLSFFFAIILYFIMTKLFNYCKTCRH